MRYETRTERIGERVADLDWAAVDADAKSDWSKRSAGILRVVADAFAAGKPVKATTDGGWPRFGWKRVLDVGMYDGWPYWRPFPSVLLGGPFGSEWHSYNSLTDAVVEGEQP